MNRVVLLLPLMAMALFKPQQGSQLATGLVSVISKDIARKNTVLDSMYAGLSVELLPPMADMDIRLNSRDQKWLADRHKAFIEQLKPFNKQYDSFFNPIWQQGPFALTIEEILLDKEQIILQLRGKGPEYPQQQ